MNPREILDASIADPPPPFLDIDDLIARERRRERARRRSAVLAGTAGVVAVTVGGALVAGGFGPTGEPGGPAATAPAAQSIPPDETPEARAARLTQLLRSQITAVLPDAAVEFTSGGSFGAGDIMIPGYDEAMASVTIRTPQGSADLSILVIRPFVSPRPQPTEGVAGRLFGGCAGDWSSSTPAVAEDRCEDRIGPGGTVVSVAERYSGAASFGVVTVAFPDGGVVSVMTNPSAPWLSPDDLVAIVADPGFVAGNAAPSHEPAIVDPTDPFAPRDLPAEPAIGTAYPFDLYTHCGVDRVAFGGRTWRAELPEGVALPGPYLAGTMELLDHGTARFVIDQRHVQTDREVIVFSWLPNENAPTCK